MLQNILFNQESEMQVLFLNVVMLVHDEVQHDEDFMVVWNQVKKLTL